MIMSYSNPFSQQISRSNLFYPNQFSVNSTTNATTVENAAASGSLPSTPPGSSSSQTTASGSAPKRARVNGFSLQTLLEEFDKNHNPPPEIRKQISQKIGLSERSVRIWFQNRRAKVRKMEKLQQTSYLSSDAERLRVGLHNRPVDQGKTIPMPINDYYSFIHASLITVGHWQRVKQDAAVNYFFIPSLNNLSPVAVESLMTDPLDLAIILSRKDNELNYFFSTKIEGEKVLFRIFFSLNDVHSSSILPTSGKTANTTDYNRNIFNSELMLFLSRSPRFAVYFTRVNHQYNTQNIWTVSEDFSINRQVKDAHNGVGGTGIPHRIIGRKEPLEFLHNEITHITNSLNSKAGGITRPLSDQYLQGGSSDQNQINETNLSSAIPPTSASAYTGGNHFDNGSQFSPSLNNYNFPSTLTTPTASSFAPSSSGFHSHTQSTSSMYSLDSPGPAQNPSTAFLNFDSNSNNFRPLSALYNTGVTNGAYNVNNSSAGSISGPKSSSISSYASSYPPQSASTVDTGVLEYGMTKDSTPANQSVPGSASAISPLNSVSNAATTNHNNISSGQQVNGSNDSNKASAVGNNQSSTSINDRSNSRTQQLPLLQPALQPQHSGQFPPQIPQPDFGYFPYGNPGNAVPPPPGALGGPQSQPPSTVVVTPNQEATSDPSAPNQAPMLAPAQFPQASSNSSTPLQPLRGLQNYQQQQNHQQGNMNNYSVNVSGNHGGADPRVFQNLLLHPGSSGLPHPHSSHPYSFGNGPSSVNNMNSLRRAPSQFNNGGRDSASGFTGSDESSSNASDAQTLSMSTAGTK